MSAKDFAWDVELRSNAAGGVFNITGLDIVYTASDNSETASFTDTLDHLEQYKVNFYYSDSPNVTGISRYNATNQLLPDRVSENLLVPGQPLPNDLKDGDEVYIYMDYQFIGITPFIRVGRLRVNDDAPISTPSIVQTGHRLQNTDIFVKQPQINMTEPYPVTVSYVLDYDQNLVLDWRDLDFIERYLGFRVIETEYRNNNDWSDPWRVPLTAWV